MEHDAIRLTNRDRDMFLATLESPPAPAASLRKAFEQYKKNAG
jgi:uncharacterized protein (DUF1778 family)